MTNYLYLIPSAHIRAGFRAALSQGSQDSDILFADSSTLNLAKQPNLKKCKCIKELRKKLLYILVYVNTKTWKCLNTWGELPLISVFPNVGDLNVLWSRSAVNKTQDKESSKGQQYDWGEERRKKIILDFGNSCWQSYVTIRSIQ